MYAIVEIAGLQYKVEQDQKLFVNRLKANIDDEITFDKVLLTDTGTVTVGAPVINGVTVVAKVLNQVKGDKVIVFKKKRRKGYKVKNGHRQQFTQIQIVSIGGVAEAPKKASKKAAPKKEVEVKEVKAED
jgi:large subunit ribosomal protein L21